MIESHEADHKLCRVIIRCSLRLKVGKMGRKRFQVRFYGFQMLVAVQSLEYIGALDERW